MAHVLRVFPLVRGSVDLIVSVRLQEIEGQKWSNV